VVIVNADAGRRGRDASAVVAALRAAGARVTLRRARTRLEGFRLCRALAPRRVVVAVLGGDGTVNNAAVGLLGGRAWLAPLPGGTENLLCRELGLPGDAAAAALRLLRGRVARRDVGVLGGRPFVVMAGIGFDGEVAALATPAWKRALGGVAAHLWHAAWQLALLRPRMFAVSWLRRTRGGIHQVVFSNGPRYGGGLVLSPGADPADGRLDVAVLPWRGRVARLAQLASLLLRGSRGSFEPVRARIRSARIRAATALAAQVDGEPIRVRDPRVSVRPGALWVLRGAGA